MKTQLDPWDDASLLAGRLLGKNVVLFLFIGATQWCEKCKNLRPQFDRMAAEGDADEVWLWLDLVDHEEFIGNYQPDNLPTLLVYKDEHLVYCQAIEHTECSLSEHIDEIQRMLNTPEGLSLRVSDPGIRTRLLTQDWAID
ncbi:thioredoxin family protein [Massilia pseudoviolaceinigra]|uniref:thioredoxin family protein n=1 Tax=Massilia pseudoviolaceinigra TaxID=3057165 RepID=UPI002796D10C|nr:thioredoxin family protein [Massilia sp. CCM 9206]MDQ1918738.1 thioredoxin family protein [Massilia sp. CCM 9206]